MCETISVNDQKTNEGGNVDVGQFLDAEGKKGRVSKLARSKALLLQLNLRHTNYATEVQALRAKLSRVPGLEGVLRSEFRGEAGAEKLRAILPACPTEAARRRLFRLILLEGRLMPTICRQIYDLDIEVS